MKICVIGLGKIGQPLAVQAATQGHEVIGVDTSLNVVAAMNRGESNITGEPELSELLGPVVTAGRLRATTRLELAVGEVDIIMVVVPLLMSTGNVPDFSILDSVTHTIGRRIRPGTLVSYETTLPVGTTRSRFAPRLAELSGLTLGTDLYVCFSPERVYSGKIFSNYRDYPKIVGGVDIASTVRGIALYESIFTFTARSDLAHPNGVWPVSSADAAELVKLVEATYRDVNIALANEFARYADQAGLDIASIIEAANSQPFSHIHRQGVAVGGHCIPVYPLFYLLNHPAARLPKVAREINDSMPGYAVELLEEIVGDLQGLRVVILGITYRGGVKEVRLSGALQLASILRAKQSRVLGHDPLLTCSEIAQLGIQPYKLGDVADAAIVQADHECYGRLRPSDLVGVKAIVDGRRVMDAGAWSRVVVKCIGSPALLGEDADPDS